MVLGFSVVVIGLCEIFGVLVVVVVGRSGLEVGLGVFLTADSPPSSPLQKSSVQMQAMMVASSSTGAGKHKRDSLIGF